MVKKSRMFCNFELLHILSEYLEENPDIRFSQALMNCYLVKQEILGSKENPIHTWQDEFYLESDKLLERVKKASEIKNEV